MEKSQFDITGMTCTACSARIEKVLSKQEGVDEITVNLLTNSMSVCFDPKIISITQIINKVEALGYGAKLKAAPKNKAAIPENSSSKEIRYMKNRLITSFIFAIPLLYTSMGEMLGWPLPAFLSGMENAGIYSFTLLLLTIPILVVNRSYYLNGFKNLSHGS
ncbi:MAG: cation transporter, partial [Firmicutes bacterium]|nr:cation transporter [Bacillota bacterium]